MDEQTAKAVEAELKRFAADLNLSDEQKAQFKTALQAAAVKVEEIQKVRQAKLQETRAALRAAVEQWLTPEQLVKWDAEMAKAKSFLGQQV